MVEDFVVGGFWYGCFVEFEVMFFEVFLGEFGDENLMVCRYGVSFLSGER